jgi:hypothetical protein
MQSGWMVCRLSSLSLFLGIITHIFNTILTPSIYPAGWKTSIIMPVAKKSEPSNMSDDRPISVLPTLSKAIEIIMKRQINAFLMDKGLLGDYQSGFRSHHSTSTVLMKNTNDLFIATNERLVSLLEFSRHLTALITTPCSKLSSQFRFTTSAVSLIMSHLSDRRHCVRMDGALSAVLPKTSGIVHGSVFGPLLFSMFINGIVHQITSCRVHLYADDVQIYISCEPHRIENCIHNMNMDLDRIHQWSIENCLALNSKKSQALLVNPSILASPIVSTLLLGPNHIAFI